MTQISEKLSTALAGRYRIERRLGEGGMATVYLAEDLKHDRKVAIKVLRPELAAVLGAERFVQEIKTTANLQHPNILPLHDSGDVDGFLYYVMPYIAGETLRDKLNREKQLGIDEAVKITTEVADALDYAHRHNVIHRDVKPENILLHDGRPMVADFGIALALSAAAGGRMTETGLSLGTPHYMSPEQATAEKDLSNRSDIYSLGAVLYETLTGDPPHTGSTAQQIIMKIVTDEPRPITELRRSVPPNVAAATAKALEKLPADRFESAKRFAEALSDPGFTTATAVALTKPTVSTASTKILVTIAAVAALLAAWGWLRPTPDANVRAMSVQLGLPEGYGVRSQPGRILALSPDGSRLAVVGRTSASDVNQLLVRPLEATRAEPVPGSERARDPVWSPSGDSLAFIVGNEVRVASLLPGGRVSTLTASAADDVYGTSWSTFGEIAFGGPNGITVLRVADGAEQEFPMGGESVLWLHWVPGQRRLTFTHFTDFSSRTGVIGLLDVETGGRIDSLTVGFNGRVTTSGHLVWSDAEGTVWAAPVDTETGRLEGAPVAVMNDVQVTPGGGFRFALARSGDLAYIRRTDRPDRRLVVVTVRTGDRQEIPTPDDVVLQSDLDLSPDGSKVAYSATQFTSNDVWITDIATGRPERFSDRWRVSYQPVWTPGGERLLYTIYGLGLVWRPYDKSSALAVLTHDPVYNPSSWSADGTLLLGGQDGLWALRLPDSVPTFLSETEGRESMPALSPDGRWLAYTSDRDGSDEIWVQAFEGEGGPWKVSEGGGWTPTWSASGDRLYFRTKTAIMASGVAAGPTFVWSSPTVVLASAYPEAGNSIWWEKSFDVFPDGERIVLYEQSGPSGYEVTYETRWVQRMLEGSSR